jgi:hypothetical protein
MDKKIQYFKIQEYEGSALITIGKMITPFHLPKRFIENGQVYTEISKQEFESILIDQAS